MFYVITTPVVIYFGSHCYHTENINKNPIHKKYNYQYAAVSLKEELNFRLKLNCSLFLGWEFQ